MPERLYTLKEACLLLGLHPRTIQKWDKQGKIGVLRTPAAAGEYQNQKSGGCRVREAYGALLDMQGFLLMRRKKTWIRRKLTWRGRLNV